MGDTLLLALRVSLSLALVLALLWFLARRVGDRTDPTRRVPITVLGRQSLGRRSGVVVVEVGGRALLLGVSDTSVQLLTEVDQPGHTGTADVDGPDHAATAEVDGPDHAATGPAGSDRPGRTAAAQSFTTVLARQASHEAPAHLPPRQPHRPTTGPAGTRHRGRRRAPAPPPGGALSGSVLAPSTWSRTWAALQERSGR